MLIMSVYSFFQSLTTVISAVSDIILFYANKIIMTTLRDTMMAEEDIVAAKRRFGLFNQPPPLAVGDDSLFPVKRSSYEIIQ